MRHVFVVAISSLILSISMARGEQAPFNAGVTRFSVAVERPFESLIWYPTPREETSWQVGPITVPASYDADWAVGRFPIVLLAHGGGPTGGGPSLLAGLSAGLARYGFVVIAPFHGKAGLSFRTVQEKQAFDAALADPRFAPHLDPNRLGMVGFSLGGAVALELAGARPDAAQFAGYCAAHLDDLMSCSHAPDSGLGTAPTTSARLPLKAMALLDPFVALFSRDSLHALTLPILLFRPSSSALPGEGNFIALAEALPHPASVEILPGGHFIFVSVCPPAFAAEAPELCRDAPGVDRAAVQIDIQDRMVRFFRENL